MRTLDTPEALALRLRNGEIESAHYGHLAVVDRDGQLHVSRGAPHAPIYARSTLKPVQALPLLMTGAADAFGLEAAELAIAMASHAGTPSHVAAVERLLAAADLAPSWLQCGTHAPLHEPTALALACKGEAPSVLQCNCSGKHAGMLAVCRHMGWELATYRDVAHPLQRAIKTALAVVSGVPEAAIAHGVDGCGVPVWHLPLSGLARAFAQLATPDRLPEDYHVAAARAIAAMVAHPALISGDDRLDTDLMLAGAGRLVSKIGGEGVHAGGLHGVGLGWAIKVLDGQRRGIGPALARALAVAGHPLPADPRLEKHLAPATTNNHGAVLGRMEPGW